MYPLTCVIFATLTMHSVALVTENREFIKAVSKLRESNGTLNGVLPFAVPFHASIQVNLITGYKHLCGGSIIHAQVIMTAAHCFYERHPTRLLSVVAGVQQLSLEPSPRYPVSRVVQHESYSPFRGYDIALVWLKTPLPIDGSKIDTVDYRITENMEQSKEAYLIGWSSTQKMLEVVDFTTINSKDCRRLGFKSITSSDLCAYSKKGRGACDGDSGGALLSANMTKQLGILSYGKTICKPNHIYVYTHILRLVSWIDANIKSSFG
ncbi:chymotrypsin-1-like [Rhagoletis pomonella]|uniref:chymotrypsin-1-like n=1 Tax=Rhagoletis pomonella TaxID=28610 RepID=UPI0017850B83|nr:chymotrypsin-1-like [Rhagoletis pomonella]